MAKDFKQDDLVWAKMKGFAPWPARVAFPADGKVPKSKKPQHYVFFFGTHDHAWITDENIEPYSEEKLANAKAYKKKSATMLLGIEEIEQAYLKTLKKAKTPSKDKVKNEPVVTPSTTVSPPPAEVKSEKPKKKLIPKKRESIKAEKKTPKRSPKKTAKKRPASDDIESDLNASKVKDEDSNHDFRFLIANVPPNNRHLNAAVIPPYEGSHFVNGAGVESAATSGSILSQTSAKRLKGGVLSPTDKKIGFLGLGAMGVEMVTQLLATKHDVTIWNRRNRKEHKSLVKDGAKTALSPAAVVQECDITICCVLDSEAVKNVVYGKNGVLEGFDGHCSGKAYVEMSSIDPTTSQEIAEAISGKGGKYLEAPMVGQRQDVSNRSMVIICAGDRGIFTECGSLWAAWSTHTFYVGPDAGYANKMSLILKMMAGVSYAALSESMALLQQCGVKPQLFMEVLSVGPCNFPLLMNKGNAMAEDDDTVYTPVKHQQKDLALAVSLGDVTQQPLALAVAANEAYVRAAARDPDSDVSSIHLNTPINPYSPAKPSGSKVWTKE